MFCLSETSDTCTVTFNSPPLVDAYFLTQCVSLQRHLPIRRKVYIPECAAHSAVAFITAWQSTCASCYPYINIEKSCPSTNAYINVWFLKKIDYRKNGENIYKLFLMQSHRSTIYTRNHQMVRMLALCRVYTMAARTRRERVTTETRPGSVLRCRFW